MIKLSVSSSKQRLFVVVVILILVSHPRGQPVLGGPSTCLVVHNINCAVEQQGEVSARLLCLIRV